MRFSNQIALISGGAEGLGKAIAHRLADEGASLVLIDQNQDVLNKTMSEMEAKGINVKGFKADVSNDRDIASVFEKIENECGKLDIAINSAGIVGPTKINIVDVDVEDFNRVQAVNVTGSFLITKYSLKLMEKNNYGRILLIASIAGKEGNAGMCCYSSSKSAVIGLTKSVGKEYAETGITINALAPAVIRTSLVENMPADQVKLNTDKIPMKRCGTLEEAGAMAAFICSTEASFNTGFVFDLSGGRATY